MDLKNLRNRYLGLRHGLSEANAAHLIISDPQQGTKSFGLTELGRTQVLKSLQKSIIAREISLIFSSDFLRTKQTAEVARIYLNLEQVDFDIRLRERFFGKWDQSSDQNYAKIWLQDQKNESSVVDGVESILSVAQRTLALLRELEEKYENRTILLVSHGDPLQILQAALLSRTPLAPHKLPAIQTGELRVLVE